MLTLFHSPNSRSSRIMALIDEMGIAEHIAVQPVSIPRMDGTGSRDPANPHPEGKVPALVHDGTVISESGAVILYLTALFPDSGMAPRPGDPRRGDYLTWLFWYGSVMEPVLTLTAAGISHPYLTANFRGVAEINARLHAALDKGPWLLGDSYSAADLLIFSPYAWFKDTLPDDPLIQDWVARCSARPARARVAAADAAMMAARAA